MNLNRKTILFHRDNKYEDLKLKNKNMRVVLLDEEVFIKIVNIKEKNNIDKVIKNVVDNTFYNYSVLVDYRIVNICRINYLVVYFIRYYHKLREIIEKGREVEIVPIQFINNISLNLYKRNIDVFLRKFENVIYLVIKINGVVFYGKNYYEHINVNDIKNGLEIIKSYVDMKNFKVRAFVHNKIYCEEFKPVFNEIKVYTKEVL